MKNLVYGVATALVVFNIDKVFSLGYSLGLQIINQLHPIITQLTYGMM